MKKIIIGNWKMNKTVAETKDFIAKFKKQKINNDKAVVICPSYTGLSLFSAEKIKNSSYGAQNVASYSDSCWTGEVSAKMLSDLNCQYVIVGHSERREKLGESNDNVSTKISQIIENKMIPILCIGESAKERKEGKTSKKLLDQLKKSLKSLKNLENPLVVAYEPIWAISDGKSAKKTPTVAEIEKELMYIKKTLIKLFGEQKVENFCKVVYGGSVNSGNSKLFLSSPLIDGLLVGGASLEVSEFVKIINS
jgi:triosephosphate isomerase